MQQKYAVFYWTASGDVLKEVIYAYGEHQAEEKFWKRLTDDDCLGIQKIERM